MTTVKHPIDLLTDDLIEREILKRKSKICISIKIYKENNNLTQKQLGEILGESQSRVSNMLSNPFNISMEKLYYYAMKLDMDWDSMIFNIEKCSKE